MDEIGVFGPTKCGKTTLVKALCREFHKQQGLKTVALDPWRDKPGEPPWGPHATVFRPDVNNGAQMFWETVWQSQRCVIVVDETTTTIARDKEKESLFTAIRHNHHKLIVIGHNGRSLTPTMRQQLDGLFLFLQSPKAAQVWVEETACQELIQATTLGKYEFLRYERFQPVRKLKLAGPC